MKRILWLFLAAASVAPVSGAQTPGRQTPVARELTALLNEFLSGVSRNDPTVHERFWTDDLIYTSASGRRIGKADILQDARPKGEARPAATTTSYAAEDVRVHEYGDTAILAFQLVATTPKTGGPQVSRYLNTGTFVKRGGRWQAAGWQATRLEDPKSDSASNLDAARAELLRVDEEWAAAAGSPDLERIVSYWSEDAVVTPPRESPVAGKAAIRKYVGESMKIPGFSVGWKPGAAAVSASGDLGYTTGTNVFTFPDASGKVVTSPGRYVTVWKKDGGGKWRCVVDFWNEAPAAAPEPKK